MVSAAVANHWAECMSRKCAADWLAQVPFLLAQAEVEKRFQLERLDPATRVKALAALTGLIILMIGLMVLASLGARWARNYGHRTRLSFETRPKRTWDEDDWAAKPLAPPEGELADDETP